MNILSLAVVPLTEFIRNFTGFLGSSRRYQITSTSRISNATPRKLQPFIWTGEYTAQHSTTRYHTAPELTVKEEINIGNTFAARGAWNGRCLYCNYVETATLQVKVKCVLHFYVKDSFAAFFASIGL
jgi:hypothetical protein